MQTRTYRIVVLAAILAAPTSSLSRAAEPANQPDAATKAPRAGTQEEGSWSAPVNGLQTRIVIKQDSVSNGTLMLNPFLELRNVSHVGNPMKLAWNLGATTVRAFDAQNNPLPTPGSFAYDGGGWQLFNLVLPATADISFSIRCSGAGIPADQAGLMDLGPAHVLQFPRDGKDYFFQLVIEVPGDGRSNPDGSYDWHGKIEVPAVKVPLTIPKLDAKTAGQLIDQWGPKLLSKNANEYSEAVQQLSLIDDDRLTPWYVKAVATKNYEVQFAALERLGRLKGDEALAGLKIGLDDGNDNIRYSAALGLARSPHPDAKRVLMGLANEGPRSVRLLVVQTCAAMNRPEGWAIVSKATGDVDEMIRDEAARLWKDHEKAARQP